MDYLAMTYFGLFLSIFTIGLGIGILWGLGKQFLQEHPISSWSHRVRVWHLKRTRTPDWPEVSEAARINRERLAMREAWGQRFGTTLAYMENTGLAMAVEMAGCPLCTDELCEWHAEC